MKIRVLGCSGGIGMRHASTTSLLIDDDILIDAGTGVGSLSLDALMRIDHVFLTHAHLDHVACLPLLLDSVGERRADPVTVHCTFETESALRAHIFNDRIWPDFTRIPSVAHPFVRFETIALGRSIECGHAKHGARAIQVLPAVHTAPAVAYRLDGATGSLIFSGDTIYSPALADAIRRTKSLRYLLIETAFPDGLRPLAEISKHMCPSLLAEQLRDESPRFELWITHLKPGHEATTMAQLRRLLERFAPRRLARGQVFDL